MTPEQYLAQARRPDGSIRPLSEILASEHNAAFAARSAELLAEREVEARKSATEKLVEGTQKLYDHFRKNDDRHSAKFYKDQLDLAKEKLASEKAAEAKRKLFAGDRRIELIRQEAELIERSGVHLLPNASQLERDELVAIARSDDWPDPQSQFAAFTELSNRLTDAELEAERVKQSDAEIEANRQSLLCAESNVRTAGLEQLRAKREAVADGQ